MHAHTCDRCGGVIPETHAPVWADSICDECEHVPLCARCAGDHLQGKDNAAGIQGTISRLESLNDDGTPAPPTQEEAHVPQADAGAHTSGLDLDVLLGIDRSDPEQVAMIHLVELEQELKDLESTDPVVSQAAQRLQETMERIAANIHQVYVSKNALNCTISCAGPLPHVHEYRAADVRPSAEQTARNNAADANKLPDSNKN